MTDTRIIAIDAMTAEKGVDTLVDAVMNCLDIYPDVDYILVGDQENEHLASAESGRIHVCHSTQILNPNEGIMDMLRKRDSSTAITAELVKKGEVDAGISFGTTKGVVGFVTKRIRPLNGIKRVPLAIKYPTYINEEPSFSVLLDVGATSLDDCTPQRLLDFAVLGSFYAQQEGKKEISVGLLCNGTEPEKGTKLLRDAYELFQRYSESKDPIFYSTGFVEKPFCQDKKAVDVIVTDGFSGNIALKVLEDILRFNERTLKGSYKKDRWTRLAGWLSKKTGVFDEYRRTMNPDEYNGAYFLGLEHPFVKGHGASSQMAIECAIGSAYRFLQDGLNDKIKQALQNAESFVQK